MNEFSHISTFCNCQYRAFILEKPRQTKVSNWTGYKMTIPAPIPNKGMAVVFVHSSTAFPKVSKIDTYITKCLLHNHLQTIAPLDANDGAIVLASNTPISKIIHKTKNKAFPIIHIQLLNTRINKSVADQHYIDLLHNSHSIGRGSWFIPYMTVSHMNKATTKQNSRYNLGGNYSVTSYSKGKEISQCLRRNSNIMKISAA